jgi:hypothetical protein
MEPEHDAQETEGDGRLFPVSAHEFVIVIICLDVICATRPCLRNSHTWARRGRHGQMLTEILREEIVADAQLPGLLMASDDLLTWWRHRIPTQMIAILASGLFLLTIGVLTAEAGAWCAWYADAYNCGFQTVEQCRATTFGDSSAYCAPNPNEPSPPQRPPRLPR